MTCSEIINIIISGLTAIATLFTAIIATYTANQSNKIAKRSLDITRLTYEHSQSGKISVWLTEGEQGSDIILHNGFDSPVYNTFVGGGISNKGDGYKLMKGLATNALSSNSGLNHSLGVVPLGTWLIKANIMMNECTLLPVPPLFLRTLMAERGYAMQLVIYKIKERLTPPRY